MVNGTAPASSTRASGLPTAATPHRAPSPPSLPTPAVVPERSSGSTRVPHRSIQRPAPVRHPPHPSVVRSAEQTARTGLADGRSYPPRVSFSSIPTLTVSMTSTTPMMTTTASPMPRNSQPEPTPSLPTLPLLSRSSTHQAGLQIPMVTDFPTRLRPLRLFKH